MKKILSVDKNMALEFYYKMKVIRLFEEKAIELFKDNLIRAVLHLYIGEEAVAVGVCSALEDDDYITSTHRGHGHCIAKGADVSIMMAELFGKATGYCKGKGGSMHIAAVDKGILGANGIVGGGLPIAVGAGLSSKLRKTGKVVACFFGDGAANTGSFHESLNLAAIFRLPILFVCENNCYAVSTPIKASISIESISERALAYGIRGISVDGNNVIEIYQVAKEAIEHIRSGEGPVLLEAKTYRIEGHYYGDVGKYRSKEEVDVWRRKDPIQNLATQLLEEGVCSEDDLSAFDKMANQKIDGAVDYAKNSPDPIPEDALADVY